MAAGIIPGSILKASEATFHSACCFGEGHADSVFWAEDHHGAGCDGLAGNQAEVVFSEQNTQDHEDLQHGVVAADAASRAGAEGQMSEGRVKLFVRFGEAFRGETLRVLPILRRMVYAVNEHDDRRAAGYGDIACAVIRESHSVDHPKWRIQAQSFQDYLSCELELRNV